MTTVTVDNCGTQSTYDDTTTPPDVITQYPYGVEVQFHFGGKALFPWHRVYRLDGAATYLAPSTAVTGLTNPLPVVVENTGAINVHLL